MVGLPAGRAEGGFVVASGARAGQMPSGALTTERQATDQIVLRATWRLSREANAMAVIDVHTHMFTRVFMGLLKAKGGIYNLQTRPDGQIEIFRL